MGRVCFFHEQFLANTVWALLVLGHWDGSLFAALARASERRVSIFYAQDLANTVWAFL